MKSMKFLFRITLLSLIVLLASCHKHDDDIPQPEEQKTPAQTTLVVYMMAENSLSSYVQSDINEMILAKDSIPLDCNLVVYLDNTKAPTIYTISAQTGQAVWQTLTEVNSCDSTVFRNNLQSIVRNFPAHHYRLVMWSHGSGWVPSNPELYKAPRRTIGVDNLINSATSNKGAELNITAMRDALQQVGVHWDCIFFDACFMQCVETDYELRDVADYIIGSPAEIPGNGAPYHRIMSPLMADSLDAPHIARIYFDEYTNYPTSGHNTGLVISVADTKQLPSLLEATRKACPDFYTRQVNTQSIQFYCPWAYNTSWKPEYFDLASTMNLLLAQSDYTQWHETLRQAYPLCLASSEWMSDFVSSKCLPITDPNHLAGASIFIPQQRYASMGYNNAIKTTRWYQDY